MSDIELMLISKMIEPDEMRRVYDANVSAEVFEDDVNRVMFEFMMRYWQESQMQSAPTWKVMQAQFPANPLEVDVEESTDWMCDWLKKRYQVNQGQDIIRRAAKFLGEEQSKPDGNPGLALQQMWQESYEASQVTTPRSTKSNMADNVAERRDRYNRDRENANLMGVSFGLDELDEHTRGQRPGELAAVAARTKVGKSWLLANCFVANHMAGRRPLLYTLEMDIEEMEDRIDCLYSGVSYSKFTRRELSVEEMLKLDASRKEMAELGSVILARPERGNRTVRTMTTEARQQGADLLLVDQLSWIDAEQHYTGDRAMQMKHGDLIADFKQDISSASAGKIPGFCAIQLNRQTMSRDNSGRGSLENFANSDMIGQTVDIALGLWRNNDMRNSNIMGLDIMGTRRCDAKSWNLAWHLNLRTEIRVLEENVEPE